MVVASFAAGRAYGDALLCLVWRRLTVERTAPLLILLASSLEARSAGHAT